MKILFLGRTQRSFFCLKELIKSGHNVIGVVLEENKKGDIIEEVANENKIPLFYPKSFKKSEDGYALLEKLQPDLAILCVYEKILPKEFITFFEERKGAVNLHGGKVPQFRGSATMRWQIAKGAERGAFTILKLSEGMDDSSILGEHLYDIIPEMTIKDVFEIEHRDFPKLLVKVVNQIQDGSIQPKQQEGIPCYWHKRIEKDRQIDWKNMTASEVHNLIRAETKPYAGAYTTVNIEGKSQKIRLWSSSLETDQGYQGTSGRVARKFGSGVIIIAKDKGLIIQEASIDGEDPKPASKILKYRTQLE